MTSTKLIDKQSKAFGWIFIVTGLPFILISIDVITIDESTLHAPKWVLGLCGGVFSLAGIIVVLGPESKISNLLVALLILSFALIGGWVAFFGEGDQFSGGTPILNNTLNISLARVMFGIGSLVCFIISFYTFRLQFKQSKEPKE